MNPNLLAFSFVATLTVLAALGVVFFPNAVRSALSLVATFFLLAVLYFTLRADLLGISQIVVYAGAIMVLFLFVIMLLNLGSAAALAEKRDAKKFVGGLLGVGFVALVGSQVFTPLAGYDFINAPGVYGQPQAIGMALFTDYGYPFEAVSVLLMVGIVGSILLAKAEDSVNGVPLVAYLVLGLILFSIGVVGVVIRRSPIVIFMCIELMLNAVNLTVLAFARYLPSSTGETAKTQAHSAISGEMVVVFVMAVAAAEVAVGLGIIMAIFRLRDSTDIDQMSVLRG